MMAPWVASFSQKWQRSLGVRPQNMFYPHGYAERDLVKGIYLEITCIFNRSLMAAFKAKAGESAWGGVRGEALLA